METVKDENGNDKVVWENADGEPTMTTECGPIVGPYTVRLPANMNLGIGQQVITAPGGPFTLTPSNFAPMSIMFFGHSPNTEWARLGPDGKLVYLDMDLCAKGPHDAYTALAIGIWNEAIEEAARYAAGEGDDTLADLILELKK